MERSKSSKETVATTVTQRAAGQRENGLSWSISPINSAYGFKIQQRIIKWTIVEVK
jgi:hypothetical protein